MRHKKAEERRIRFIAGLILISVTLLSGISIFLIMERHAKDLLGRTLQQSLQNRILFINSTIEQRTAAAVTVATRPFLIEQIQRLEENSADTKALKALARATNSFLATGFSQISVYGKDDALLARAGLQGKAAELTVALDLEHKTELMWRDGFVLRVEVPMQAGQRIIGKVISESSLSAMTNMFSDVQSLGQSSELALCAPLDIDMQCFPLALTKKVFKRIKRVMNDKPLPMSFALAGKSGIIISEDYRQKQVVAAYSPVKKLGLGTVLKIDTTELYAPVIDQAKMIGPLLVVVLALGVLLMQWLVAPLVKKLVVREKEAHNMNAQLVDSETRVRTILENIVEGIVTISESGVIDSFNLAAERMFGYKSEEVIGKNVSILVPEAHRKHHDKYIKKFLKIEQSVVTGEGLEVTAIRKDGHEFPMGLRVSKITLGGRLYLIGTLRDITERKAAEATILRLANHDPLTDLPNRNLLQDRIEQAISRCQRSHCQFATLFIDLDQFKMINDLLGHDAGDALLQSVATRLRGCLRNVDTVARQGGDEFIVLLANVASVEDSAVVARKILSVLSEPHIIGSRELQCSASIGIATYPDDGTSAEVLLKNSDAAMYSAKDAGRNNYQFFTEEMNTSAAKRLTLETNLRSALSRGEMSLHYQPIVSVKDGSVVATEALLRWSHPEFGYISPAQFIPIAEESGLIVSLGAWVLRSACMQLKEWEAQGVYLERMVVNLSTRQFRHQDLVQTFTQIFRETGVNPDRIGLEITESVIMEHPENAIKVLRELKALGIQLSLDDFGTGFSSLSYLKRFPIDKLKIDRSFVKDIATDSGDEVLITAIIAMAHSLGITVVAEGVEKPVQLDFIRQRYCEEYQGYYFSKPLPPDELRTLFHTDFARKGMKN